MKTLHLYPTLLAHDGQLLPVLKPIKLRIPDLPAGVPAEIAAALEREIVSAVAYAQGGLGPRAWRVAHCRTIQLDDATGRELPHTDTAQEPFGATG